MLLKKSISQFTSYNAKSENNRIFRAQLHPPSREFGQQKKLRYNQEEIPYIFTKPQNFLNFRDRDVSLSEQ